MNRSSRRDQADASAMSQQKPHAREKGVTHRMRKIHGGMWEFALFRKPGEPPRLEFRDPDGRWRVVSLLPTDRVFTKGLKGCDDVDLVKMGGACALPVTRSTQRI